MGKKLWQTTKSGELNSLVETFETKDDLLTDQRLIRYDCLGSIAQAAMLKKIKILSPEEYKRVEKTLNEIIKLERVGKFKLKNGDEDIHTKIENFLVKKNGSIGAKIHTGRSRNDQVVTALRLFMKDMLQKITVETDKLITSFQKFEAKYGYIPMPGYTHMQKAMPSSISLWIGSFTESFQDDLRLIHGIQAIINKSPLGSAAGYGVPVDLKRSYTSKLLGFEGRIQNSLYVQSSRGKYEAMIIGSVISVLQTINKFATDVMLYTTSEFGFFIPDPDLVTGSSIMPHKKNLDLAELLRSKLHLVLGHYTAVISLSANLPSGYNRDLQDTKKPLFESLDTVTDSLRMTKILIEGLKPDVLKLKKAMSSELYAAQEAIKLTVSGIPFRSAYRKIAGKYRRQK